MTITTQSADGILHEFPDGTPNAVVDKAMQDYAAQSSRPAPINPSLQVANPSQNWSNIGAESLQTAGIKPLTTNAQTRQGAFLASIPFNLGDEAVAASKGLYDVVRGKAFSPGYNEALSQARDTQSRFESEHPIANFGLSLPGNIAATTVLPGGPIAQGTLSGAIQGAGVGEGLTDRATKAGMGGVVGGLTSLALTGASKTLTTPNVNPDVQLLKDAGVPMTPGQIAGGVGKKMEDVATSIPIMGDLIAKRQGESITGLNRAVANRSLGEINQTLPANVAAGRDTVAYVRQAMSDSYTKALSGMQARPDMPFSAALQTAKATAASLPDEQLSQFTKLVNSEIFDKVAKNNGMLDGDAIKGIESTLTAEIKGYGAGGWNDQKLAAALTTVKSGFRDLITRQNPTLAPQLAATDRAYANYAILRRAGSAVGNDNGVFTPSQLLSAIKGSDTSAGKGNFATGTARMQDLADAAKNVLPSKVPDSGTARRLMQAAVLGTGGPAAYFTGAAIPAAGAIAAGSAAYSTPGQELLRSLMTGPRSAGMNAVGRSIQTLNPALSTISALLLAPRVAAGR